MSSGSLQKRAVDPRSPFKPGKVFRRAKAAQRLQRRDSSCRLAGLPTLRFFEIARVLVRLNHACFIINADRSGI
jgi:hypothetical protein